jgi:hypothetical protein
MTEQTNVSDQMSTVDEFLATRERLFEEVLNAEPGEKRLQAFAKFEHRDRSSPDMEHEVSLKLCYLLTRNRMANEIIEMRADQEAVKKRYDEIGEFYGPRMFFAVAKMVGWCSPPRCCVCGSEEDRGPDDPFKAYSSDSWGPDWMHRSCEQKFTSWADDEEKRPERDRGPRLIPEMAVLDAAWREKKS